MHLGFDTGFFGFCLIVGGGIVVVVGGEDLLGGAIAIGVGGVCRGH